MPKPLDFLKKAGPEKTSKLTVVYMGPENGPFRCGSCEYFSEPNACQKVEGIIQPEACCNLFSPKEKGKEDE